MRRPPHRLHTPEWFTADDSTRNVALVYPMQGPAGPSRVQAVQLAGGRGAVFGSLVAARWANTTTFAS